MEEKAGIGPDSPPGGSSFGLPGDLLRRGHGSRGRRGRGAAPCEESLRGRRGRGQKGAVRGEGGSDPPEGSGRSLRTSALPKSHRRPPRRLPCGTGLHCCEGTAPERPCGHGGQIPPSFGGVGRRRVRHRGARRGRFRKGLRLIPDPDPLVPEDARDAGADQRGDRDDLGRSSPLFCTDCKVRFCPLPGSGGRARGQGAML